MSECLPSVSLWESVRFAAAALLSAAPSLSPSVGASLWATPRKRAARDQVQQWQQGQITLRDARVKGSAKPKPW